MKTRPAKPILDRLTALSDGVRLRILRILEAEELSVGEVAKVVQLPQSTVSRQLKVLSDAEWVARRNEGTATFYRLLADDLCPESRGLWVAIRENAAPPEDLDEDQKRLAGVIAERKTDSLAFFGRFSGEWDHLRNGLFGERFTSLALLSLLRPDWIVGDIGCGTGNASELLAPAVERVIAVDLSGPMLDSARQRLSGVSNIDFVEGAAHDIGLKAASLDAAVCMLVLHHVDEPAAAIREMRRTLRADRHGGVAIVVDMVRHSRDEYRRTMGHKHLGFGREQMEHMMRDAGFAQTRYRELPAEPDARGPGLFVAAGWIN
jgi:SAM-dependent methyltransferase